MSRRQDTRIVARTHSEGASHSYLAHADLTDEDARLIGLGLLFEAGFDQAQCAVATVTRCQVVHEPRELHPIPTCKPCHYFRNGGCAGKRGVVVVVESVDPLKKRPGWCPGFKPKGAP